MRVSGREGASVIMRVSWRESFRLVRACAHGLRLVAQGGCLRQWPFAMTSSAVATCPSVLALLCRCSTSTTSVPSANCRIKASLSTSREGTLLKVLCGCYAHGEPSVNDRGPTQ